MDSSMPPLTHWLTPVRHTVHPNTMHWCTTPQLSEHCYIYISGSSYYSRGVLIEHACAYCCILTHTAVSLASSYYYVGVLISFILLHMLAHAFRRTRVRGSPRSICFFSPSSLVRLRKEMGMVIRTLLKTATRVYYYYESLYYFGISGGFISHQCLLHFAADPHNTYTPHTHNHTKVNNFDTCMYWHTLCVCAYTHARAHTHTHTPYTHRSHSNIDDMDTDKDGTYYTHSNMHTECV